MQRTSDLAIAQQMEDLFTERPLTTKQCVSRTFVEEQLKMNMRIRESPQSSTQENDTTPASSLGSSVTAGPLFKSADCQARPGANPWTSTQKVAEEERLNPGFRSCRGLVSTEAALLRLTQAVAEAPSPVHSAATLAKFSGQRRLRRSRCVPLGEHCTDARRPRGDGTTRSAPERSMRRLCPEAFGSQVGSVPAGNGTPAKGTSPNRSGALVQAQWPAVIVSVDKFNQMRKNSTGYTPPDTPSGGSSISMTPNNESRVTVTRTLSSLSKHDSPSSQVMSGGQLSADATQSAGGGGAQSPEALGEERPTFSVLTAQELQELEEMGEAAHEPEVGDFHELMQLVEQEESEEACENSEDPEGLAAVETAPGATNFLGDSTKGFAPSLLALGLLGGAAVALGSLGGLRARRC